MHILDDCACQVPLLKVGDDVFTEASRKARLLPRDSKRNRWRWRVGRNSIRNPVLCVRR
jgi:hypothetical protein